MTGSSWAWIDGDLSPADEARVGVLDRGLQYGDGVFETLRAERGRVFFLEEHLERMARGLVVLGIEFSEAGARAREAIEAVLAALAEEPAATVKVIATRGTGGAGPSTRRVFRPTLIVTGRPDAPERPEAVRAITSTVVRNERSPLCGVKSLNYLEMTLARGEAEAAGVEEAILLNTRGRVSEASAANVFLVRESRLLTPSLGEGCLPGIVRAVVLRAAAACGIDAAEGPVVPGDLTGADELFLTNSRIGVAPLVELDGKAMGEGVAGPLTERIREAFRQAELASWDASSR
jgi:aminodeoxychorismate lyase